MTAAASVQDIQIVTFTLDSQEYGIDVMAVREIIGMTEITKTANSSHYLEGIINLRGTIVPVISLRKRFGLVETLDATSCIAIMQFSGELTGFIIDDVTDVMRIRRDEITPAPAETGDAQWMEGIVNLPDRMVIIMDLQHLKNDR